VKERSLSRRRFLKGLVGGAPAAVAFPYVLTGSALARPGRPGANDRIYTGHIGLGARGSVHLRSTREGCAALCDVDARRIARSARRVGGTPLLCKDYRRVLDRKDIDAVIIATPDHWHAVMTVHACQAGKDVYCETPACTTIAEGRAMVRAATRHGRVVQIGAQYRSDPTAISARNYVGEGRIGKVRLVTCWDAPNPVGGFRPDTSPPAWLDWDLWLGPASPVPYNKDRAHSNFRWLLEFGGGRICGDGSQMMSMALWCLGQDCAGPVSVRATGEPPHDGTWNCPVTMQVVYEFKDPDWTLVWSQPGEPECHARSGVKYWGDRGIFVVPGGGQAPTEAGGPGYVSGAPGLAPSVTGRHMQNWFECLRTRRQPVMSVEAGHRAASLCILGNLAWRLRRTLLWDPGREQVPGDDEANCWLEKPGRGPWHV